MRDGPVRSPIRMHRRRFWRGGADGERCRLRPTMLEFVVEAAAAGFLRVLGTRRGGGCDRELVVLRSTAIVPDAGRNRRRAAPRPRQEGDNLREARGRHVDAGELEAPWVEPVRPANGGPGGRPKVLEDSVWHRVLKSVRRIGRAHV